MFYNTMVALPMSLSLMKDRLEQGYYRQVEGVMGDVATIEGNARVFNGEDSQVADLAAGHALALQVKPTMTTDPVTHAFLPAMYCPTVRPAAGCIAGSCCEHMLSCFFKSSAAGGSVVGGAAAGSTVC